MQTKAQIGLASFQFMINGRRAIFYTFLTLFMQEALGADLIQVGLVITLPMFVNSTMQALVWGRLSDKIQRRRLLVVVGETSAGIGYLLLWTTISVWNIIIGLTLIESIWSMSNTGWAALFADLTEPHERSTIMGRINSLGVVGRLVGISTIGLIYDFPTPTAGFPLAFPIAAGIMFISAIILVALVPEIQPKPEIKSEIPDFTHQPSPQRLLSSQTKGFFIFLLSWMIITIGWTSYMSLFTIFLRNNLQLTAPEISLVMNFNAGIGLLAAPVAGYLGDQVGRKPVLITTMVIQAVTTVLYGFALSLPVMLVVATLNGIPRQIYFTVGYAMTADLIPEGLRGRLFGIFNAAWTLSFGGSPTFVGGTFAQWRQTNYLLTGFSPNTAIVQAIVDTFYLSAGIVLMGALLFITTVRETRQNDMKPLKPKTPN